MPEPPLIAERNCKSLKNYFMPTRLTAPLDAVSGNVKCDRSKCLVCQNYLVETENFRSGRTGEVFTIRHKMTFDSANIVYPLHCDTCSHINTLGKQKKKNGLKISFCQHGSNINSNTGIHVTRHFSSQNHTLANMKCLATQNSTHR